MEEVERSIEESHARVFVDVNDLLTNLTWRLLLLQELVERFGEQHVRVSNEKIVISIELLEESD